MWGARWRDTYIIPYSAALNSLVQGFWIGCFQLTPVDLNRELCRLKQVRKVAHLERLPGPRVRKSGFRAVTFKIWILVLGSRSSVCTQGSWLVILNAGGLQSSQATAGRGLKIVVPYFLHAAIASHTSIIFQHHLLALASALHGHPKMTAVRHGSFWITAMICRCFGAQTPGTRGASTPRRSRPLGPSVIFQRAPLQATASYGCFQKLDVLFVGALIMRGLLLQPTALYECFQKLDVLFVGALIMRGLLLQPTALYECFQKLDVLFVGALIMRGRLLQPTALYECFQKLDVLFVGALIMRGLLLQPTALYECFQKLDVLFVGALIMRGLLLQPTALYECFQKLDVLFVGALIMRGLLLQPTALYECFRKLDVLFVGALIMRGLLLQPTALYGCFRKLDVLFVGALINRGLLFWGRY